MLARPLARERRLLALGALLCAAVLLGACWAPRALLTGWLAGAVAFGAIPSGALLLAMMIRLIPGAWARDLRLGTEAATLLAPWAALAMLPVLVGMAWIYPWVEDRSLHAFQLFWLAPLPFAVRLLLRFAAQIVLGRRLRRRHRPTATSAAGVVAMPLLSSLIGVDWLMSLDPDFASSAFGLRFVLIEVVIAFCALLLLRVTIGATIRRPTVLGGLLLTLLLLSAYFLFLPFFVVWSSNLATNVGWYAARWDPLWLAAAWAFGLLGGLPLLALLFAAVRSSSRWLALLAGSVLLSQLVELAWIALPGRGAAAVLGFVAAVLGLGLAAGAGLLLALRARIEARLPEAATR